MKLGQWSNVTHYSSLGTNPESKFWPRSYWTPIMKTATLTSKSMAATASEQVKPVRPNLVKDSSPRGNWGERSLATVSYLLYLTRWSETFGVFPWFQASPLQGRSRWGKIGEYWVEKERFWATHLAVFVFSKISLVKKWSHYKFGSNFLGIKVKEFGQF